VFAGVANSYKLYRELSNNNILTHPAAIIDWGNETIEQQWRLARRKSKMGFLNQIADRKMVIPNVVKVEGFIIPTQPEDLFQLGILTKPNSTLEIHMKKIAGLEYSQAIIIQFITPFDTKILYRGLYEKYSKLLPKFVKPGASVYSFSVMLNWAHIWKDDFKSVRFTNIYLEYDIAIDKRIIIEALPEQLRYSIKSKADLALRKSNDALQFMDTLNANIQRLQDQELKDIMDSISYVESAYSDVKIHSIKCKVHPYEIGDGYPLYLPDFLRIEIRCSIDAKEQAIKGKLYFDQEELERFIFKMFSELNERSTHITS
jgi:hypothetical protein